MGTFGEIVEPVSRVAWEDWDDEEFPLSNNDVENANILEWNKTICTPDKLENLIIIEGKYLSDLINLQDSSDIELVNSVHGINLRLYLTRLPTTCLCIIQDTNLVQCSEIVELLKPYIMTSSNVVTILSKSLVDYQGSGPESQSCIIRTISTTNNSFDLAYPKLEQPNIISGVSAGVIFLREHLNLPGIAVIYYIEYGDNYQEEFIKLFKKLNIPHNITTKPSSVLSSNLYI